MAIYWRGCIVGACSLLFVVLGDVLDTGRVLSCMKTLWKLSLKLFSGQPTQPMTKLFCSPGRIFGARLNGPAG